MSSVDPDATSPPRPAHDEGAPSAQAPRPLPILAVLRAELPTLPPQLRQLAQVALESPAEVGRMTITDYAARAGSSAASVTRLCRALGVSGFSSLRMELALAAQRSDQGPVPSLSGDITAQTPLPDLVSRLALLGARSMEETARLLDQDSFETVIGALGDASHVYAIGAGSAHAIAVSLEHKLRSLSIPATSFHDPPSAVIGLAAARPGDVLVVVSDTGTESECIPPLTEAKRRGCVTVLITRLSRSPGAVVADHVLLAVQDSTPLRTGTLNSRISETFLVDCLASGVVVGHHERSVDALSSVEEALDRYW
ncbi:MurR/RpiR family transcriptional regulator [Brachybacterium tyrofermentans]|uniref:MurR/RpiR family transcriptional regulator n=1 Tax=Brachybacterium tyrofermentans TaxID=47848 RepID=A0ABW0FEV2_9MICO